MSLAIASFIGGTAMAALLMLNFFTAGLAAYKERGSAYLWRGGSSQEKRNGVTEDGHAVSF